MRAVVHHLSRDVRVEHVPDPKVIHPTDGVLQVTSTAICGSDLHLYNGLLPRARPMVAGHEFMGVVEAVGADVRRFRRGDRVVAGFAVSCGTCWFCRRQHPAHCERSNPARYGHEGDVRNGKGGGLFGYTEMYGGYAGGQAEGVRVPWIDHVARRVPDDVPDEKVLFASALLPTGLAAVEGADIQGGETVAVFGAGPVGIATARLAWLRGAARVVLVDVLAYRLAFAQRAANVETIQARGDDAVAALRALTDGRGPDVCVDAVGMEVDRTALERAANMLHGQAGSISVLETAIRAVRRAGTLIVLGMYATPYDGFPWHRIFEKGLSVRAGLAEPQARMDGLIALLLEERLRADDLVTHTLPLEEAPHAYRLFNDKQDGCVKVVLKP